MPLTLTPKQQEAALLIRAKREILLEGGSRSGKTLLICAKMIVRAAKYPGTRHLSMRYRFSHARQSLFLGTFRDTAELLGARLTENRSDWYFTVPSEGKDSEIWIGGLDDKERTEKILGNEYTTIHINEASQVSFSSYEILKTRLNPPSGVPGRILIDYNPPATHHWGYKIFHEGINPGTGAPLNRLEDYGVCKMNPVDNVKNLSEGYLETLKGLSDMRRKRFLHGEYTDGSEGALWEYEWIAEARVSETGGDLQRVVVAVDPAVSGGAGSDDTGIIVVGSRKVDNENHFYVLADHTYHGEVTGWARRVIELYNKYDADKVIAEVNNGGDLVEASLRAQSGGRRLPFKAVRASRGKAIRAEPVADLYRQGRVHHVGVFDELESQMTYWTPEDPKSPDNLDALVWGISWLSQAKAVRRVLLTRHI